MSVNKPGPIAAQADPAETTDEPAAETLAGHFRDKLMQEGLGLDDGAEDFASAVFEAMLGTVLSTAPPPKGLKRSRPRYSAAEQQHTNAGSQHADEDAGDESQPTILRSADLMRAIAAAKPAYAASPGRQYQQHRHRHDHQPQAAPAETAAETAPAADAAFAASESTSTSAAAAHASTPAVVGAISARRASLAVHRPSTNATGAASTSLVPSLAQVVVVAVEQACVHKKAASLCASIVAHLASAIRAASTPCCIVDMGLRPSIRSKRASLMPAGLATTGSVEDLKVGATRVGQAMAVATQIPLAATSGSDFRIVSPGPTAFLAQASALAWAGALDTATVADFATTIRTASQSPIIYTGSDRPPCVTVVVVFLDTASRHEPSEPATTAAAAEARTAHAAADRMKAGLPTVAYAVSAALGRSDVAASAAAEIASRLLTGRWLCEAPDAARDASATTVNRRELARCDDRGARARHDFYVAADAAQRAGKAIQFT